MPGFMLSESASGLLITGPAGYVLTSNGDGTWSPTPGSGSSSVDSDQVLNVSDVPGFNVSEALETLLNKSPSLFFQGTITKDPMVLTGTPGVLVTPNLQAGLYIVSMSAACIRSSAGGEFSIGVNSVDQTGGSTPRPIITSQLCTGPFVSTGSTVINSDGSFGLRIFETAIVPIAGSPAIQYQLSVMKVKDGLL